MAPRKPRVAVRRQAIGELNLLLLEKSAAFQFSLKCIDIPVCIVPQADVSSLPVSDNCDVVLDPFRYGTGDSVEGLIMPILIESKREIVRPERDAGGWKLGVWHAHHPLDDSLTDISEILCYFTRASFLTSVNDLPDPSWAVATKR